MWPPSIRQLRDSLGLVLGTTIAVNETLLSPPPDQTALLFAGLCLAGVFALRQDERK